MLKPRSYMHRALHQAGLTLIELLVSLAISATVLSGVVQVLLASKSTFISERELATLQENARFALKNLTDEIRMAGYTGCPSTLLNITQTINSSAGTWYLGGVGLLGYEYDAGIASFPSQFASAVKANTDAIVVRRGEATGLRVTSHTVGSSTLNLNKAHSYKPGQPMLITTPDCLQLGLFQMSGPANASNTATTIEHKNIGTIGPGNCTNSLRSTLTFTCSSGVATATAYDAGSSLFEMQSEAYYVGNSTTDSTVPALFRERLMLNTTTSSLYTASEELVQGVENMQILYGLDNSLNDGIADIYVKANNPALTNWKKVVSVRLTIRMRSIYPIYTNNVAYGVFEGITGTGGSDRFMRQTISTTIQVRNF